MVRRMNGETELTFKQLRELALAHQVEDSKTVIGIWASTVYIKMSNDT